MPLSWTIDIEIIRDVSTFGQKTDLMLKKWKKFEFKERNQSLETQIW